MIKRLVNLFDVETTVTTLKGAVGIGATTGGFYISILPKVEAWLRIISLLIGCAVGLATFVSIIRNQNQKSKAAKPHSNKSK